MSARSTTLVGLIVAVLIIGAVATIGYYQFQVAPNLATTSTTTTSTAACTPSTCVNVTIFPNAATVAPGFAPDTITVVLGRNNTVVWLNNDTSAAPHTVTPRTSSPGWQTGSGQLALGDTYTYTFSIAGTYQYYCTIHPQTMTGTIIVKS